ncbi:DNA polymerase III subunit delta' [Clostridium sp.]|uniref:DNA polymerase III subunit delta' n=1 Tax=Clostridium sp. TaxID=1506 RepID=UPI0025B86AE8|nr:DNA polymerase III subunit delta' [Clostridium sp.]MCI9070746.1 DNA polymerase III subunit delta' [Clostridium sp.]
MRKFIGYKTLINNFKFRCMNNTLSHAHLIAGEDGIGKSKLANILAKLILNGDLNREYVDIINYKSNKSSFGVDDIRNIIDEVYKKPFEGDKKVIIIYEGNKLTIQAQNALLKTIEEPPAGIHIIILCESLELILDTIKSRCEIYKLTPLTKEELYDYIIMKEFNYNENEIKAAIAFSEGIPGRIDRYFNDDNLKKTRNKLIDLVKDLNKNNFEVILHYEENLIMLKDNKEEILNILSGFIRDILIYKEVENNDFIINMDKFDDINELTKEMSFKKLNNMIIAIEEARKNIKSNVSWIMTLRIMLMSFMEG